MPISSRVLRVFLLLALAMPAFAADHNDPNSINSIFSDIDISAADLYDIFGWPADDKSGGEKVVLALTFASIPRAGVFDRDVMYRILLDPDPRVPRPLGSEKEHDLAALLRYAQSVGDKYLKLKPSEVRVTFNANNQARIDFLGFPAGNFSKTVDTNQSLTVSAPGGHAIKVYIGGRDDAFFNDLPGFFRSINYAPQFYHVPLAWKDRRELPIPKTLLELEGNKLFNFDPANPRHGSGVKTDLPPGPYNLTPKAFRKDANGNYRFVYSGRDAQAGINVNAIILEVPLAFLTKNPAKDRIVNAWGESWVRKAAAAVGSNNLSDYKRVDTDGIPFADAGLSEREDSRQLGANNLTLARHFVIRFGHLGWGFAPSVSALGLPTCFDHDNSKVSIDYHYTFATAAFPRVKQCFFQELRMPDASWNPKHMDIKLRRTFEIFIPNVNAIDMDTNGTWPFGRRLEDQVATRFLSTFLDHRASCAGAPCNVDTLGQQALWDAAPIEPKTPPNPLANDKPFLAAFPYLAEPHTRTAERPRPNDELWQLWSRLSLTSNHDDFHRLEEAIARELETNGPSDELYLYRASLHVKLHRLEEAKADLALVQRDARYVEQLRADIATQEKRYEDARRWIGKSDEWVDLARLAYIEWQLGHRDRADALYASAEDQLTAKHARAYAWVEEQRAKIAAERK